MCIDYRIKRREKERYVQEDMEVNSFAGAAGYVTAGGMRRSHGAEGAFG